MNTREFAHALEELAADRRHGASELARQCLHIIAQSARQVDVQIVSELRQILIERATALAAARPSMTPIQTLLLRWQDVLAALPEHDLAAARHQAATAAQDLRDESRRAMQRAAGHARSLIGETHTIITHSVSSTIREVFRQLRGCPIRVILTESRPLYEGRQLASQLADWHITTTLITDAQLGVFAAEADVALVGADTILADGSVINKAGTFLLALAAREHTIPFYVCAESFKSRPATLGEPEYEEMAANEVVPAGTLMSPSVTVRNVYFDRTPAHLISGWINENGVRRSGVEGQICVAALP